MQDNILDFFVLNVICNLSFNTDYTHILQIEEYELNKFDGERHTIQEKISAFNS